MTIHHRRPAIRSYGAYASSWTLLNRESGDDLGTLIDLFRSLCWGHNFEMTKSCVSFSLSWKSGFEESNISFRF